MHHLIPGAIPSAIGAGVALVTFTFLFLGYSDADLIYRFLRVDITTNPDPKTLITQLATGLRILLPVLAGLVVSLSVLIFARREAVGSNRESVTSDVNLLVLPQAEALQLIQTALGKTRYPVELHIWGFSLGWAVPLYRYLREQGRSTVTIRLFVPGDAAWSLDVDYSSVSRTALRTRQDTTIHEWMSLVASHRAREVRVYGASILPNDNGARLADEILLLGTYNYQYTPDRRLLFVPNDAVKREFIVCQGYQSPVGKVLLHWCKQRFACRQFDSEEITERYLVKK